jgi:hypothetical protein
MAAQHGRHEDDGHGHAPSLPETEERAREDEAAADREVDPGHAPSLPETERRERENEARDD